MTSSRHTLQTTGSGLSRLLFLDQLRGYAIFGMILVNYIGYVDWAPDWFSHNRRFYSYADTIAPLFIFVVGMGFRLSVRVRASKAGEASALWYAVKRYAVLVLVGIVFYGPNARVDWWDALVQIGLSGLVAIGLINRPAWMRVAFATLCLAIFTVLFWYTGYGEWMVDNSMNGGPLSPIAYVFVLLAGTIAFDLLESNDASRILRNAAVWTFGCLAAGIVLVYLMPNASGPLVEYGAWSLTAKRWSQPPFILLSTATSFAAFAIFYWLNEVKRLELPHLSALGLNPLAIYLLQYSLLEMHRTYLPREWTASGANPIPGLLGYAVFYGVVYAVAKRLHNDKIYIKI